MAARSLDEEEMDDEVFVEKFGNEIDKVDVINNP